MLKIDIRRSKILERLKREGTVSVSQLASELGTTPVTIRSDLDALEAEGYLRTEPEHQTLCLTEKAAQVLYRGQTVLMKQRKEPEQPVTAPVTGGADLQEEDQELYDVLRNLRSQLARKGGMAPYMVFSNAALEEMATRKPTTISAFRRISGVGEMKASWYGEIFTRTIKNYLDQ
jgi:ATP-dependent DNA helicase RecQ